MAGTVYESLRYTTCKKYLTVLPIHIYSEDNSVTCGYCPRYENKTAIRNFVFEYLVKYFHFPCINEPLGCFGTYDLKSINLHEENCEYRQLNCSLESNGSICNWKGTSYKLYSHVYKKHRDSFSNNKQLKINIENNWSKIITSFTTKNFSYLN